MRSAFPFQPPLRQLARSICRAVLVLYVGFTGTALLAHQVPNLTLEVDFSPSGEVEFRLNLDPRLFLAEDPKTLPPVPALWFREQSATEKAETLEKALTYVKAALTFMFDDQPAGKWTWEFLPIDGATGERFTDETAEVHLLATVKTRCPDGATASSVQLENPAKAPMVLLNSLSQQVERRPQILFPGETSRPFRYLIHEAKPTRPADP